MGMHPLCPLPDCTFTVDHTKLTALFLGKKPKGGFNFVHGKKNERIWEEIFKLE